MLLIENLSVKDVDNRRAELVMEHVSNCSTVVYDLQSTATDCKSQQRRNNQTGSL